MFSTTPLSTKRRSFLKRKIRTLNFKILEFRTNNSGSDSTRNMIIKQ